MHCYLWARPRPSSDFGTHLEGFIGIHWRLMSSPFWGQPVRLSLPDLAVFVGPEPCDCTSVNRWIMAILGVVSAQSWVANRQSQRGFGYVDHSLRKVGGARLATAGEGGYRTRRPELGQGFGGEALAHPEHRTGGRLHRAAEDFSVEIRGGRVMQIA